MMNVAPWRLDGVDSRSAAGSFKRKFQEQEETLETFSERFIMTIPRDE